LSLLQTLLEDHFYLRIEENPGGNQNEKSSPK
jgi:hypothetical protein